MFFSVVLCRFVCFYFCDGFCWVSLLWVLTFAKVCVHRRACDVCCVVYAQGGLFFNLMEVGLLAPAFLLYSGLLLLRVVCFTCLFVHVLGDSAW